MEVKVDVTPGKSQSTKFDLFIPRTKATLLVKIELKSFSPMRVTLFTTGTTHAIVVCKRVDELVL